MIPIDTKQSIDLYVAEGYHPGGFLTAVLSNNLVQSLGQADEMNKAAIHDIVKYVYNQIPGRVWGSPEKVKAHLESFKIQD